MASSSTSVSVDRREPLCLVRSSINVDQFFHVKQIVRPGETISSTHMVSRAGGKGANVSAAIALTGGSSSKGKSEEVVFVGAVGADASWPIDELESRNVDVSSVVTLEDVPTGRAFIQVASEDGENSIVLLKGANHVTDSRLSDPSLIFAQQPRPPTNLVLQNEIPLSTTLSFLRHASSLKGRQRCWTIFNPSPMLDEAEIREFDWEKLDVLVVNEGEGNQLLCNLEGGHAPEGGLEGGTLTDGLSRTKQLGRIPWIVVTRGKKGVAAVVRSSSSSRTDLRAHTFEIAAAKARIVKDTTGAGDTFTGALVARLMMASSGSAPTERGNASCDEDGIEGLKEDAIRDILKFAASAAALAVEKEGALESIPTLLDVEQRMHEDARI